METSRSGAESSSWVKCAYFVKQASVFCNDIRKRLNIESLKNRSTIPEGHRTSESLTLTEDLQQQNLQCDQIRRNPSKFVSSYNKVRFILDSSME